MADYVPNTIVCCLTGVPLDDTYTDVRKFGSIGEQSSWMMGHLLRRYDNCTYQRVNSSVAQPRGPLTVRVPDVADALYNCNYIMFQNSNYGQKWFYAFVRQVNYINPNNTEIVYELDHYQTWQFDFEVQPSYIEREHVTDDSLYKNLQPEPFGQLPQMVQSSTLREIGTGSKEYICILVASDPDGNPQTGTMINHMYTGAKLLVASSAGAANNIIQQYCEEGHKDNIVTIFMCPYDPTSGNPVAPITVNRPTDLGGYVPKNNKLFTSQFCGMVLSNLQDSAQTLEYEGFADYSGDTVSPLPITINIGCLAGPVPAAYAIPSNYNGNKGIAANNLAMDVGCTIDNFPQCAWTTNGFTNWIGGAASGKILGLALQTAVSAAISAATGGASDIALMQAGTQIGAGFSGLLAEGISEYRNRADLTGNPGLGNLAYTLGTSGFQLKQMCIRPETAKVIDMFFNMYGYACNQVKVPNLTGRVAWNYVKTRNVVIKGSMPVQAMDRIKQMFNSGVRFWHQDMVGDFSLSNDIG